MSHIPVFLLAAFPLPIGKQVNFSHHAEYLEIVFVTSAIFTSTLGISISKGSVLEGVVQRLRVRASSQNSGFKSQFRYLPNWVPGEVTSVCVMWPFAVSKCYTQH